MGNSQKEDERITLIQVAIKILNSCVNHTPFANITNPYFHGQLVISISGLLVREEITVAGLFKPTPKKIHSRKSVCLKNLKLH